MVTGWKVGLLVLLAVSSTFAATMSLDPLPWDNTTNKAAIGRAVAATSDGSSVYVAGYTRNADNAQRAAYWTLSGGTVGAPMILPGNTAGTVASNAYGVDVLSDGSLVISGNLAGGTSDWCNKAGYTGGSGNGWTTRLVSKTQASVSGQANLVRVGTDGHTFYNVGKNSASTAGYNFIVDPNVGSGNTRATTPTLSSGTVQGVSSTGLMVGETRVSTIRRAFVCNLAGTMTLLPGVPERTDQGTQGYGISADGNTVAGLGYWTDTDTYNFPLYWTNDDGTWNVHKLGQLPTQTSSSNCYAVNQNGTVLVGTGYPDATRGTIGVFWETNVLDDQGRPKAVVLRDFLVSKGVSLTGWGELRALYSATTVGGKTYIVGDGDWTGDGATITRSFIAVIPEPATLALLAIGLPLLRRRS